MSSNTTEPCENDFHYWVEKFCINVDREFWSWIIAVYFFLEIIMSMWMFQQTFVKIKKIKHYDKRNPDDLTYCQLSLKIMNWIRL